MGGKFLGEFLNLNFCLSLKYTSRPVKHTRFIIIDSLSSPSSAEPTPATPPIAHDDDGRVLVLLVVVIPSAIVMGSPPTQEPPTLAIQAGIPHDPLPEPTAQNSDERLGPVAHTTRHAVRVPHDLHEAGEQGRPSRTTQQKRIRHPPAHLPLPRPPPIQRPSPFLLGGAPFPSLSLPSVGTGARGFDLGDERVKQSDVERLVVVRRGSPLASQAQAKESAPVVKPRQALAHAEGDERKLELAHELAEASDGSAHDSAVMCVFNSEFL